MFSLSAMGQEFDLDEKVLSAVEQTNQALQDTLVRVESTAMSPVDSIQAKVDKINQKAIDTLQSLVPDKAKELGRVKHPQIAKELEEGTAIKAPEVNTEVLQPAQGKVEMVEGKSSEYVEKVKTASELGDVKENIVKADQITNTAAGYQKEAKAIANGDIDKTEKLQKEVEQKVSGLDKMQALKEQAAAQEKYKSKLRQLKNAEYIKSQLQDKLKEAGIGNLSDYKGKVKETMGTLSKYKKKYSTIQTSKEIPEKRDNPLSDKKFKERLVIGGNFQLHSGDPVALDISPLIGYRFTPKLSFGIGGTYRQSFKEKDRLNYSVVQDAIGGRAFGEYKVIKSFFVHAEFEVLQTAGHDTLLEGGTNHWNKGALAGIGREFNITKNINGNVILLYNFLHQENGPYQKPLMIRFGLDF